MELDFKNLIVTAKSYLWWRLFNYFCRLHFFRIDGAVVVAVVLIVLPFLINLFNSVHFTRSNTIQAFNINLFHPYLHLWFSRKEKIVVIVAKLQILLMGVLKLFLFVATVHFLEAAVSNECKQLGFSDTLLCSSCVEFEKHTNHEQLVSDCKRCCVEEETVEEFYTSAKITVCS